MILLVYKLLQIYIYLSLSIIRASEIDTASYNKETYQATLLIQYDIPRLRGGYGLNARLAHHFLPPLLAARGGGRSLGRRTLVRVRRLPSGGGIRKLDYLVIG